MDIDPLESATNAGDDVDVSRDRERSRLNSRVAITVALLATFLGVCKVKDDNIVQAMQQAQADKLDHWNFYQARNIRQEVATAAATQLKLAAAAAPPAQQEGYRVAIALLLRGRSRGGGQLELGGGCGGNFLADIPGLVEIPVIELVGLGLLHGLYDV